MSLILRNNITRPLTHDELDNNLIYLNINEWVKQNYVKGQYILRKVDGIGFIYYCETTHNGSIYDKYGSGDFIESYRINNSDKNIWVKIGEDSVLVDDYRIEGTNLIIGLDNGASLSVDVNEVSLTNSQYGIGISNHSYELISGGWGEEVISGTTYNTKYVNYGYNEKPAKENVVVVNLNTNTNNHHLLYLPTTETTTNNGGITYKIVVKSSDNLATDKYLMIFSPNKRIISSSIKTLYQDSYFLPLETSESVEIIWDGFDYLVTNIVKQPYISLNAKNFNEMNTQSDPLFDSDYIERDITELVTTDNSFNFFLDNGFIDNYFE